MTSRSGCLDKVCKGIPGRRRAHETPCASPLPPGTLDKQQGCGRPSTARQRARPAWMLPPAVPGHASQSKVFAQ
eukprot:scaffold647994_cov33-Prasinocladus_malaysianus.AAC.1